MIIFINKILIHFNPNHKQLSHPSLSSIMTSSVHDTCHILTEGSYMVPLQLILHSSKQLILKAQILYSVWALLCLSVCLSVSQKVCLTLIFVEFFAETIHLLIIKGMTVIVKCVTKYITDTNTMYCQI